MHSTVKHRGEIKNYFKVVDSLQYLHQTGEKNTLISPYFIPFLNTYYNVLSNFAQAISEIDKLNLLNQCEKRLNCEIEILTMYVIML